MTNITQSFSKTNPDSRAIQIERFAKIDAEMEADSRAKLYRKVRIRCGDIVIDVHLSRSVSGYHASARFGGKGHSAWGKVPSQAFGKVQTQILWTLDKLIVEENMAVRV